MSGLTCDCCGKKDHNAGVCCSGLGAISFSYCLVCHAMGAEPKGLAKDMFPEGSTNASFAYYENDKYYDLMTDKVIPIKLKDGREFNTRQEVIDVWESERKE